MSKVKKVKTKTHKGTKKVLNIRQSGSITKSHGGVNHQTGKDSARVTRRKAEKTQISKSDLKRLKNVL